jgi:hypothetical protein
MKTNRKRKTSLPCLNALAVAAALLWAAGCQTVSISHTQDLGGPRFAPSDPAQVQILRTEPTRPHVRLGEVRAEPSDPSVDVTKIEAAVRKEAAKMGADAAVVVYDKTQVTGAQVVGGWLNRTIQETEGRIIIAVAIKYKKP